MTDRTELILLLSSDPVIRKVMEEILLRPGYVVLAEGDLGKAVQRISETVPDLLIIRPFIEAMTGHQAAIYLRKKAPGMPVLMVGGLPDDDRVTNREELQGFEIFPKPFSAEDFLARVEEVLAKHAKRVRHHHR